MRMLRMLRTENDDSINNTVAGCGVFGRLLAFKFLSLGTARHATGTAISCHRYVAG
jgi:hypothetical protein